MIIWAGTSNEDVGMVIEHYPNVVFPERSQDIQEVPGRNGSIVLTNGSFKNYEQQYSAFLDSKNIGGLERVMPKVVDWLLGNEGYQRLEDSYFPDFYRMAFYSGGTSFISMFNEYGEGTLTFNCAPEKYYKTGEWPIDLTMNQMLLNPSAFSALPLITVTGSGSGTLTFNGNSITISNIGTSVTIDVKLHKAYNGSTNRNNTITGNYENLKLGKSTVITWSGGITGVKVVPRWWTI